MGGGHCTKNTIHNLLSIEVLVLSAQILSPLERKWSKLFWNTQTCQDYICISLPYVFISFLFPGTALKDLEKGEIALILVWGFGASNLFHYYFQGMLHMEGVQQILAQREKEWERERRRKSWIVTILLSERSTPKRLLGVFTMLTTDLIRIVDIKNDFLLMKVVTFN